MGRSFLEGRSYVRGRAPNLKMFAQFSVVCMFNWMLGQLRKAVGRSFLEGRSHVRGKTPSLNRLSNFLTEGDTWTARR